MDSAFVSELRRSVLDMPRAAGYNRVLEIVQVKVLHGLEQAGAFADSAFMGGTALRVLHGIRRFSEDIDLSSKTGKAESRMADWLMGVSKTMETLGIACEVAVKEKARYTTISTGIAKIGGLLHAAGVSDRVEHKLMVKIELDTRPPAGAIFQESTIDKFGSRFSVSEFDLPSMFAGKIHAILSREYTKARDYFDLDWYLDKRVQPNLEFLNNALVQSGWKGRSPTVANWRDVVAEKVSSLNEDATLKTELARFVEHESLIRRVDKGRLLERLGQRDLER
ncbi:MAG: nucleotidyl transferase AbiEii/AbiGii toxin family protein [Deltaproteobacteria bacterium]|nr:nucleotidyl transferase AbiEii/AbiGii toxin family protein [Deltaproteobacteria bacterium]